VSGNVEGVGENRGRRIRRRFGIWGLQGNWRSGSGMVPVYREEGGRLEVRERPD
jgi:hypothetical protein